MQHMGNLRIPRINIKKFLENSETKSLTTSVRMTPSTKKILDKAQIKPSQLFDHSVEELKNKLKKDGVL